MQYFGPLYFGSPPKVFNVIFDTGSSWIWLNDVSCGQNCHKAAAFNQSESSTFEASDENFQLQYGKGSGSARLGYDTVSLGLQEGRVTRQPFLLMQKSQDFDGMEADGLVVSPRQGLSFSRLSADYSTLLDNLKAQGVIHETLFAFYLSDNYDASNPNPKLPSSLSFGSMDLEKYALSDLTYVAVNAATGYWAVPISVVTIGNETMVENSYAIIDSGTSLITTPVVVYWKINALICERVACESSQDFTVFACPNGEEKHLPDLSFTLDGSSFPLSPKHYILKEGNFCVALLYPFDMSNVYILGDAFMRAYYTVYDADNSRIGLANSINNPPPTQGWRVLVIILGVLLLLIVGVVGSCLFVKHRKAPSSDLTEPLIPSNS